MFQLDNILVHELFLTLTPELIVRKSHIAIYRKGFRISLKAKIKTKHRDTYLFSMLWSQDYVFSEIHSMSIFPLFFQLFVGTASKLYMLNVTGILIQMWLICSVDVGLHESIVFLLQFILSMNFPVYVFTSSS